MFEQEAATLTRKFGIDDPQGTIGYRLILNALQDAYRRGALATVTGVEAKMEIEKSEPFSEFLVYPENRDGDLVAVRIEVETKDGVMNVFAEKRRIHEWKLEKYLKGKYENRTFLMWTDNECVYATSPRIES